MSLRLPSLSCPFSNFPCFVTILATSVLKIIIIASNISTNVKPWLLMKKNNVYLVPFSNHDHSVLLFD